MSQVARGFGKSAPVSKALDEERERESTHGRQPGSLASLVRAREQSTHRVMEEMGIDPKKAATTKDAAKTSLIAQMPGSQGSAMSFGELRRAAAIPSPWMGKKALLELLTEGKIQRTGDGSVKSPYRYFRSTP